MSNLLPPLLLVAATLTGAAQLPPSIKTCKQTDPDFEGCLKKAIQDSVPTLAKGIPSLGMPPLDPLHFTKIAIEDSPDRPVSLTLEFNEVDIIGLSKGIIDSIEMTPGTYRIKGKLHSDSPLTLAGSYKSNGKVLVLPVQGEGSCNVTAPTLAGNVEMTGEPLKRDGTVYWDVKEMKVDIEMNNMFMHFEGLFNGDKALGDSTNKFLNENSLEVLKDLKPAIDEALGASFKELAMRLFSKVPYDSVFPPS